MYAGWRSAKKLEVGILPQVGFGGTAARYLAASLAGASVHDGVACLGRERP